MDEFFGGMDGRFRVSITDSTMMCIVHHAMDKAHEKVKSKEGVVERLNEISKFYELAVMQLEGCLKFVQEETDSCILESNHEEVLEDLTEIRDRLQGRLKESELAISEKDRELTERIENELKLRQALEVKETELVSLRAKLELERTKSEGIEEFVLGNRVSGDEDRDGEFCELKHSVDQQVWNIKQKLGPDYKLIDEERNRGIDNKRIEQMGLDIDILKETLDLAFGKMQNAIFLSQMGPIEQQWKWSIEKDTISVLIKGLTRNFQESFEAKVKKEVVSGLSEHWSDLINEVATLRCELEPLCIQNDKQVDSVKAHNASAPPSISGCKISNIAGEKSSPEKDSCNRTGKSSSKVEEADHKEELTEKEQQEDGSHYVAKMIKNHESIIRKKSEELNWLKREILRENECSSSRGEKNTISLKRRIQDVVVRLDNLMEWNTKLGSTFGYHGATHGDENFLEKRELQFGESIDTLADAWEKIDKVSVSFASREEQENEIRKLRQEKKDAHLQTMIIEETYVTLLKGSGMRTLKVTKLKHRPEKRYFSSPLAKALKDYGSTHDFALSELQDIRAVNNFVEDSTSTNKLGSVEGAVGEDLCAALLREMFKEQNKRTEGYITESLIRDEIYIIVFGETIKSIVGTASNASSQHQEVKVPITSEFFQSAESLVKEDVCMLLFRETVKELKMDIDAYNMESLIWEDIYKFVIVEAVKDAESQIYDNLNGDMLSPNKLYDSLQVSGEDNLIQKMDSLSQCFQVEEDLMLSASSELKEYNAQLDIVSLKSEEMDGHQIFEEFLVDEEHTFSSVSGKLEKALQQLVTSKSLLGELGSNLGIAVGDLEEAHDHMTPRVGVPHVGQPSFHPPKDEEEGQLNTSDSILSPLLGFLHVLVDFERIVHEKLRMNILRLEEVKYNLDPLIELVASLRNKEFLYRKAFVSRCQNLQKAELEVDMLGDQVDVLLGLLEKIYTTLHHYSPALQQYFEVSDILNLIKKELTAGAVDIPNYYTVMAGLGSLVHKQLCFISLLLLLLLLFPDLNTSQDPPVGSPGPGPGQSPHHEPPIETPTSPPTALPPPPYDTPNLPPPPTPATTKGSSGRLSGGQKAGIVIGVLAGTGVLLLGGLVYKKRRDNIRRSWFGTAARRHIL
uniref:WPP domain-containing protein n=1 Tax=Fagus sylvatica TaxID=28930 RepID=A0A2N9F2T6_FAGSY